MSSTVLECVGLYPIPVGHRVEIKVFGTPEGVFKKRLEAQPHEPQITDLDTGIVYGHHWQYAELAAMRPWSPATLPRDVRGDLQVVWSATGVVTACRVVWLSMGTTWFPQTTLEIQPA